MNSIHSKFSYLVPKLKEGHLLKPAMWICVLLFQMMESSLTGKQSVPIKAFVI